LYRRLRYFLSNFAVNPALNSANASSAITNHHAQRAIGIEIPKAQRPSVLLRKMRTAAGRLT